MAASKLNVTGIECSPRRESPPPPVVLENAGVAALEVEELQLLEPTVCAIVDGDTRTEGDRRGRFRPCLPGESAQTHSEEVYFPIVFIDL